jgi:outer membrane biosynthesis protein TonB
MLFAVRSVVLLPARAHSGAENQQDRRIAFEIVETPDDAAVQEPPDDADLLSDKNARAQDTQDSPMEEGRPYSDGLGNAKEMATEAAESREMAGDGGTEESVEQQRVTEYAYMPASRKSGSTFSREVLLGQSSNARARMNRPGYKQLETQARDMGGLSFNTYSWNFAPYLIELKRRIQKNIYPPPAFTHLGFEGTNMLRFRIYPDGRLDNLVVLDSQGEEALVETSRKAVIVSAPFHPLPGDFPEDYLEVTGKFEYFIVTR